MRIFVVFLVTALAAIPASAVTVRSHSTSYTMPWGGFSGNWAKMPENEPLRFAHQVASEPAWLTSFSLQGYSTGPLIVKLLTPAHSAGLEFVVHLPHPPSQFAGNDYTTTTTSVSHLPITPNGGTFELHPTAPLYLRVLDSYPANQGAPRFLISRFNSSTWQSFATDPGVGWELESLAADITRDGVVNLADFAHFRQRFGSEDPTGRYDLNGNERVDLGDFLIFRSDFGLRIDEGFPMHAIPEPSSALLLLAGCFAMFMSRKLRLAIAARPRC